MTSGETKPPCCRYRTLYTVVSEDQFNRSRKGQAAVFIQLTDADGGKKLVNTDNVACVHRNGDGTATFELANGTLLRVVEKYEVVSLQFMTTPPT
jgi:hypothetical protein